MRDLLLSSVPEKPAVIAPCWHTVGLLTLLASFAGLLAFLRMASPTARVGHLALYGIVIAFEWLLFAFCLWNTDLHISAEASRDQTSIRSLLWDSLAAVMLAAILFFITPGIVRMLGQSGWVSTQGMLPRNSAEVALWIAMALTAGICEETVFRGYLQRQLSGWTGSWVFGALGQALLFGLCHAYQGLKNMALISIWGCVFGAFAWWRKNLRGNMLAHAALDIFSAF